MTKLPVRVKARRRKVCYVGAPAIFKLELACKHLHEAFCLGDRHAGIYLVGSCMERPDFRDVDVRLMMDDEAFSELFPDASTTGATWEFDPRWLLLTTTISAWLKEQTGLPVDFQFQPMNWANERHNGMRNAMGLRYTPPERSPT